MNLLTNKAFKKLAEIDTAPSISIYLPLEKEPDKQDKNRIRLKNLLASAEDQLREVYNLSGERASDLLKPAYRLISNGRFSAHIDLNEGLALFLSSEVAEIYPLPLPFKEEMIVGNHFYLTPLLPLLTENGRRFYILTLSQNEIRFLQATAHNIEEVMLDDDIPTSLSDALKWEDPEERTQWHTSTSSQPGGRRRAIFHGHGITSKETQKDDIKEYFRQVASGIDSLLKHEKAPLILAGVAYLLPIYHQVSQYPYLLEDGIEGNPEQSSDQTLREQALETVTPYFERERQEAAARFADQTESEMATDDPEKVIAAAHYGQVDVLFLDKERQYWGTFDAEKSIVEPGSDDKRQNQELLGRAAVHTFLTKGTVYTMSHSQMPGNGDAAALLRTPIYTPA